MNEPDPTAGGPSPGGRLGDETDEDRALRALLERAVPHPAAAPGRMREIHARVARRRRRRAALASAGGTAAVAVAAALLLMPSGPGSGPVPPAAAGSPQRLPTSGPPSARTPLDGTDLTVTLPKGWYAIPPSDGTPAVYVTSQQAKARVCGDPAPDVFSCAPADYLPEGGAVIAFQTARPHDPGSFDTAKTISPDCRALGGDQELVAAGLPETYPGKDDVATDAFICLRGWVGPTLDDVNALLSGARTAQGPAFTVPDTSSPGLPGADG